MPTTPVNLNRETLTVAEAAQMLGISTESVYQGARRGEIPTLRVGRRVLVPAAALTRLLDGGR